MQEILEATVTKIRNALGVLEQSQDREKLDPILLAFLLEALEHMHLKALKRLLQEEVEASETQCPPHREVNEQTLSTTEVWGVLVRAAVGDIAMDWLYDDQDLYRGPSHVSVNAGGYRISFFIDGGCVDYVDQAKAPDGRWNNYQGWIEEKARHADDLTLPSNPFESPWIDPWYDALHRKLGGEIQEEET